MNGPINIKFFNISFGVLSKGALLLGPPHGVPSEKDDPFLEPSFIYHPKSPVYDPPPDSRFPSDINRPLCREISIPKAFLNVSSRVPSKQAHPRGPPY